MLTHLETNLNQSKDILFLIKEQYSRLKQSIEILKNENSSVSDKQNYLTEMIKLLTAHCAAKEQTIYDILKDIEDSKLVTYDALEEHAVAKILIAELEELHFKTKWSSEIEVKAKILAEIIEHLIIDEEGEFLKSVASVLTKEELQMVGSEFLERFDAAMKK